jgi:hypothetical protein
LHEEKELYDKFMFWKLALGARAASPEFVE